MLGTISTSNKTLGNASTTLGNAGTTSSSNSYLNAIQSLVQQNQAQQQNQLRTQQAQQNQLLALQKEQTQKAQVRQQEAGLLNSETASNSYVELLKKLMSVSNRNAALNQRMFS